MVKYSILIIYAFILCTACQETPNNTTQTMNTTINTAISTRNKNNTLAFLKALEAMNIDSLVDLFAEEAAHINPYASGIFPDGAKGKEEIRAYWQPAFSNFERMEFPVEQIHAMEDPSLVFIQFLGKVKLKNNAGWYENNYYATFKFNEEGKIVQYVEIFNPIVAAKGFGLIDQIK